MFALDVEVHETVDRVIRAAAKGSQEALARSAFDIRQDAAGSIETSPTASQPGQAPHTRRERRLARSIAYAVDDGEAVIGPRASVIGEVGEAHEKGIEFRGIDYAPRPFMGPALDRNISALGAHFEGRIGE